MKTAFITLIFAFCLLSKFQAQQLDKFFKKSFVGLKDANGNVVVKATYDNIKEMDNGLFLAEKNDKHQLIGNKGELLTQLKYSEFGDFSDGLAAVSVKNKIGELWGFLDHTGKEVIPLQYQSADKFSEGASRVKLNEKFGFLDRNGKELIPISYDALEATFSEGLVTAGMNGKFGCIDRQNNTIIPYQYEYIYPFKNGVAMAYSGNKVGFINLQNEIVIPLIYEKLGTEYNPYINVAVLNGKTIQIDGKGKELDPNSPDRQLSNGAKIVKKGSLFGLVDQHGKELLPAEYDEIGQPSNGLMLVVRNKKQGVVSWDGKEKIPCEYEFIGEEKYDARPVKKNGKYGFITPDNQVLIPFRYDKVGTEYSTYKNAVVIKNKSFEVNGKGESYSPFVEIESLLSGHKIAKQDVFFGVTKNNKVIVPFEYDTLYHTVREDVLLGIKNGKSGLIDPDGKELVPFGYYEISNSIKYDTIVNVSHENKYGKMSVTGKIVVPVKYRNIGELKNNMVPVSNETSWGLIDLNEKVIIPFQYEYLGNEHNGLLLAKKNGKFGYIDMKQKVIIPFKYETAFDFEYDKAKVLIGEDLYYINKGDSVIGKVHQFRMSDYFKENKNTNYTPSKCFECYGSGKVCAASSSCPDCYGTGKNDSYTTCNFCGGDGWEKQQVTTEYRNSSTGQNYGSTQSLKKTGRTCSRCTGKGKIYASFCYSCEGKGTICKSQRDCEKCEGKGYF